MNLTQVGRLQIYILLILFLSIIGCSAGEKTKKELNGKSVELVIKSLGKPNNEKEFVLTKNLFEYQYGLLKYYPEPEGKNISIKELCWENKNKKTVVWFHKVNEQWESLDNITWSDNIKY